MATQVAIWIFVTIVGLLVFIAPLLRRATARKLDTFQTTVLEKRKQSVLVYVELFIPIEKYFLVVEGGYNVETDKTSFNSVAIGDIISVSRYSDGGYRLEPHPIARPRSV
jgi:hypothetical protein